MHPIRSRLKLEYPFLSTLKAEQSLRLQPKFNECIQEASEDVAEISKCKVEFKANLPYRPEEVQAISGKGTDKINGFLLLNFAFTPNGHRFFQSDFKHCYRIYNSPNGMSAEEFGDCENRIKAEIDNFQF